MKKNKISMIFITMFIIIFYTANIVYAETEDNSEANEIVETNNVIQSSDTKENNNVLEENVLLSQNDTVQGTNDSEQNNNTESNIVLRSNNADESNDTNDNSEDTHENTENKEDNGNVTYASDVTDEMADSSYWADKLGEEADKVLLDSDEINTINKEIVDGSGTGVFDITELNESKTQGDRKIALANSIQSDFNYMVRNYENGNRKLYVDGELIDNIPYIDNMKNAVLTTGFENDDEKVQLYAVGTKRTEIRMFPTNSIWGYDTPDDPDDESVNSALGVNEPFVIRGKCTINGEDFYWGLSYNCSGWVNAQHVAIFNSKEEWIDAWKVSVDGKNFIVVTQDCITLDPSESNPEVSNVELKIGTILKLVPDEDIPEIVNGRGTLNNYVVYLPTRDENGRYVRSYALIPEHNNVSVGYLPLTQRNILDVAFSCSGNRYGWGGMIGAMDCSLYTQSVYKCFGLYLPRNTTTQQTVPERKFDFNGMTDVQKETIIEDLPVGSLLFFPGHVMMYIGNENGKSYVISDTGSLSDSYGDLDVRSMYSVIINPLTTRRKNGRTWLSNLTAYVTFGNTDEIADKEYVYVVDEENTNKGNVTYANGIDSNMGNSNYWNNTPKSNIIINFDKIDELNKKANNPTKFNIKAKNFLVVTQDRIILEPSILNPEISKIELPLGTVLELVPEDQIPKNIGERGPWNNYVVYIPITLKDGTIEKRYALIPEHYSVSIGYLELTPENIIDVTYRCLGDSFELMNSEEFIKSVYSCFGIQFLNDLNKVETNDVSNMAIEEKTEYLKNVPTGSIFIMPNQSVIKLGNEEDNIYVIGSVKNANSRIINSIILGNLRLENNDGSLWINSLIAVIDFINTKIKNNDTLINSTECNLTQGETQNFGVSKNYELAKSAIKNKKNIKNAIDNQDDNKSKDNEQINESIGNNKEENEIENTMKEITKAKSLEGKEAVIIGASLLVALGIVIMVKKFKM